VADDGQAYAYGSREPNDQFGTVLYNNLHVQGARECIQFLQKTGLAMSLAQVGDSRFFDPQDLAVIDAAMELRGKQSPPAGAHLASWAVPTRTGSQARQCEVQHLSMSDTESELLAACASGKRFCGSQRNSSRKPQRCLQDA
jgi:hypothetical protein